MAIPESQSSVGRFPCPFCKELFKRVGNHLPYCKMRDDRDYSQFLAQKTLKKRSMESGKKAKCPKCNRSFARLDTHLKRSATCREIATQPSCASTSETIISNSFQSQNSTENAIFFTPQNSNLSAAMSAASVGLPLTTGTCHTDPQIRQHLKLPNTAEGWEEANTHFEKVLVPAVMAAASPKEKNRILVEGVYMYFATTQGTKKIKVPRKRLKGRKMWQGRNSGRLESKVFLLKPYNHLHKNSSPWSYPQPTKDGISGHS